MGNCHDDHVQQAPPLPGLSLRLLHRHQGLRIKGGREWIGSIGLLPKTIIPIRSKEIDALCTLDANDEPTFLLLADRASPPLSGTRCGDVVGLCTSQGDRLILHGTAVVAGHCIRGGTPSSVQPIYGDVVERVFCPLKDLERLPSKTLPETTLSHDKQEAFLKGQAFVKRLTPGVRTARRSATASPPGAISSGAVFPSTPPTFPNFVFSQKLPAFTAVGLDPTAGTWESQMAEGPREDAVLRPAMGRGRFQAGRWSAGVASKE